MTDYTINNIYQGGYSSFKPSYGDVFTGYHVAAGNFALTTDPRNANIIQEVSTKLSTGLKHMEVEGIQQEILDSIPKQHLKEANRIAKLVGAELTMHGPLVEASGISKEGFSESNREAAERQMFSAVEKAHILNPNGNAPITFHSSAILPGPEVEKVGDKKEVRGMLIINENTGNINRISAKEKFFHGEEGKNIKKELDRMNEEQWQNSLSHLAFNTSKSAEVSQFGSLALVSEAQKKQGKELNPEQKNAILNYNYGKAFLQDSYRELKSLYDMAYVNVGEEDKKKLEEFSKQTAQKIDEINKNKNSPETFLKMQQVLEQGLETFNNIRSVPEIYKPLDDFAMKKSTETFANVAWNAYEKVKKKEWDNAPIISIENPPAGSGFSTGEELKQLVEGAREKFVEKAISEGVSKSEAKNQAEKLIGVTWDVGHINMLRKQGFDEEEIIKQTEAVAPFVKHIHLSDNFGLEHTELPMGMGNVPMEEIMKKLGKQGYDAKKVIEAASWWQHFKTPPVTETFQAFGSPVYTGQGPYWTQSLGFQQGYSSGYGMMLPQINYQTFGAGFSQLPSELGGQQAGAQGGRMSGRPME